MNWELLDGGVGGLYDIRMIPFKRTWLWPFWGEGKKLGGAFATVLLCCLWLFVAVDWGSGVVGQWGRLAVVH